MNKALCNICYDVITDDIIDNHSQYHKKLAQLERLCGMQFMSTYDYIQAKLSIENSKDKIK